MTPVSDLPTRNCPTSEMPDELVQLAMGQRSGWRSPHHHQQPLLLRLWSVFSCAPSSGCWCSPRTRSLRGTRPRVRRRESLPAGSAAGARGGASQAVLKGMLCACVRQHPLHPHPLLCCRQHPLCAVNHGAAVNVAVPQWTDTSYAFPYFPFISIQFHYFSLSVSQKSVPGSYPELHTVQLTAHFCSAVDVLC